MRRRHFFSATISATISVVAGCTGSNSSSDDSVESEDEETTNGNPTEDDSEETTDESAEDNSTSGELATAEDATIVSQQEIDGDAVNYSDFEYEMRNVDNWAAHKDIYDFSGYDKVLVEVGAEFDGEAMYYSPPVINVDPGTTVIWEWTGNGEHTVHPATAGRDWGSNDLAEEEYGQEGTRIQNTFTEDDAHMVKYYCRFHSSELMRGVVFIDGLDY